MWTQILDSMQYKSFIWPNNPATCSYDVDRAYAKHKYPELPGVELEDFGPNAVIITGTGEFFGEDAYRTFVQLQRVYYQNNPGRFSHPIFTDVKQALMTKLKADLEPREDYVKYSFELVKHDNHMPGVILQPIKQSTLGSVSGASNKSTFSVGDVVIVSGIGYYTSYGDLPGGSPRANVSNKVMTVTLTNYGQAYPIHCGSVGWFATSSVKAK